MAAASDEYFRRVIIAVGTAAFSILVLSAAGCGGERSREPPAAGGDVRRGLEFVQSYGCMSCHTIPGVSQARGQVGPPLAGIARRAYLGGILPNTPENMVAWLMHPQKIDPRSAMPDLGVSEPEARDMTAYLYTLK